MRIIAGRYRGRRLKSNPGSTTRPILDRAKQMLFDRLESDLSQAPRVLDVFAGTGSMGLEALSRGASSCVFIEQDHKAFELLKDNVKHVGADPISLCWRTDALKSSYKPIGVPGLFPYSVIFYDPRSLSPRNNSNREPPCSRLSNASPVNKPAQTEHSSSSASPNDLNQSSPKPGNTPTENSQSAA